MAKQQAVDITELAVLGEQFPLRLMQLGFRCMQVLDEQGRDQFRYVLPPVCDVPAGPFLMGSDNQQDRAARYNELPPQTITLDAFAIGTYPLTVAEYACFVWATSSRELLAEKDMIWQTQVTKRFDHPVVNLSWQDVLAYVRWLAKITGESWRLPTEAEWEKAARGTDGRIYPWGNPWDATRANTNDGGLKATTPVGNYPSGASPYGAQDMAGNVWEWTSTTYQSYPYQADGRENLSNVSIKTVRGGSWDEPPQFARTASRYSYHLTITKNLLGGRLARKGIVGG
jgi:formylglycine-generating enzyme required for sulfatase activity